jgi:hypothetical protein
VFLVMLIVKRGLVIFLTAAHFTLVMMTGAHIN